jgi:hypothetical protein
MRRSGLGVVLVLAVGLASVWSSVGMARGSDVAGVAGPSIAFRSQAYLARYFSLNPAAAPLGLQSAFAHLRARRVSGWSGSPGVVSGESAAGPASVTLAPKAFNLDTGGLPQNEESGAVCATNTANVLQGTNDYRGLVSSPANLTGFVFSNTGGSSITKEGQLPAVTIAGATVPSGGDPVSRFSSSCTAFAADIDSNLTSTGTTLQSGVVVRSSTAAILATCATPTACWPTAKVIDSTTASSQFLDKDWMDVGKSGTDEVVWVTYTKFVGKASSIDAVRCNLALTSCTAPIQVSDATDTTTTGTKFTQFSYVTVGPDGRVYVTYATFTVDGSGVAHYGPIKLKIANAGSTTFGAASVVFTPSGGIVPGVSLHADDFAIATVPKATVAVIGSTPRIFVTFEGCTTLIASTVCEEPQIRVRYSDNSGGTWNALTFGSAGKDNYFPTIATDTTTTPNKVAVAWYSSVNDPSHHRYDLYLAAFPADLSSAAAITRITTAPNEPDADPVLGGHFIGDYFEVVATSGHAYLNFNLNTRSQQLLGTGQTIHQQDNFFAVAGI